LTVALAFAAIIDDDLQSDVPREIDFKSSKQKIMRPVSVAAANLKSNLVHLTKWKSGKVKGKISQVRRVDVEFQNTPEISIAGAQQDTPRRIIVG
jgi:hypothetical protein